MSINNEPRDRDYDQDTSTMAPDTSDAESLITIKLMQVKPVWDFMNGFQFEGEHNVENERQDTFELEVTEADHDNFVTGLLDEVGLDAFAFGIMPTLLGR